MRSATQCVLLLEQLEMSFRFTCISLHAHSPTAGQVDEFMSTYEEMKDNFDGLRQNADALRGAKECAEAQCKAYEESATEASNEVAAAEARATQYGADATCLRKEITHLNGELNAARSSASNLTSVEKQLNQQLAASEQNAAQARNDAAAAHTRADTAAAEVRSCKTEIGHLKRELMAATSSAHDTAELDQLRQANADLKAQLAAEKARWQQAEGDLAKLQGVRKGHMTNSIVTSMDDKGGSVFSFYEAWYSVP